MKHKTKQNLVKSIFSIVGILALAFFSFSMFAIIYTNVYQNPFIYLGVSVGVLILLMVLKKTTFKRIKNKIVDIFT